MAVDNSLESLLSTLTSSIQSATEALPSDGILPPEEGISLLDVKNELLLSYLQNLVFLILLKLRSRSNSTSQDQEADTHQDEVVQKLVELRVYLEKGVRPLENRLKYNIDKILRAVDDTVRRNTQAAAKQRAPKKSQVHVESESDVSDAESTRSAQVDGEDEDEDEMSFAPRKAAITRTKAQTSQKTAQESAKDGIYKPPRITPVLMPPTSIETLSAKRDRRPNKSATLDEFVAAELSSAPLAQPSIGSIITHGGRHTKSERERREEAERRDYEEANFTRLAPLSKKEKSKSRARPGRDGGGFGGEEWRGIDAGVERIERLTQRRGGRVGLLDKSRKRERPVGDGQRGSGEAGAVGQAFEKRRKVVAKNRR